MRCIQCELWHLCRYRQAEGDTTDFSDCTTRLEILKDAVMGEHGEWDSEWDEDMAISDGGETRDITKSILLSPLS